MIISKPLTQEQKNFLINKQKPTAEDIQAAQDSLFMYLLKKVEELENDKVLSLRPAK